MSSIYFVISFDVDVARARPLFIFSFFVFRLIKVHKTVAQVKFLTFLASKQLSRLFKRTQKCKKFVCLLKEVLVLKHYITKTKLKQS